MDMDTSNNTTVATSHEISSQKQIEIHPDAVVVAKAILNGNIAIGPNTIIHPQFSLLIINNFYF